MLPAVAYVAVGSNLGDRLAQVAGARDRIAAAPWCARIVGTSSLFACAAWPAGGPEFLNGVLAVRTTAAPAVVLAALHAIEAAMGRVRIVRWEPRIIDLDLVAWVPHGLSCSVRRTGALQLPHPRAHARDFVLTPLAELAPSLCLHGRTVRERLAALPTADRTVRATAVPTW
jgi:2-amino-4-hydroxy-6-hydroxymethyldihydropteridine diphosphokinase